MAANSNPSGQKNTLDLDKVKEVITTTLDEVVAKATITADLAADPTIVQAAEKAGSILLGTVDSDELANYDHALGYADGAVTLSFNEYKLAYDRGRRFLLDDLDIRQTKGLANASYVMSEFVRTKVVPEIDKVRMARAGAQAITSSNVKASYTPDAKTFLGVIEDAIDAVKDGSGVETGTIVFVDKQYKALIRKSAEVTATRDISTSGTGLNTEVTSINGAKLIYAPTGYMKTVQTAANNGLTPGGKDMSVLAVAPSVVQGVLTHVVPKIITPEVNQNADGTYVMYRCYHDAFIPKNMVGGIYTVINTATGGP